MIKEAGALLGIGAGYLYAIKPRMGQHGDCVKGQFYAHRGLHNKKAGVPENTMAAFQKAVDAGCGIELDVQLTRDGEVVVFHDFSLRRVCAVAGELTDYTYEELQKYPILGTEERIPRLRDVLELVDGRVPLLVELKYKGVYSGICEAADALLSNYKGDYSIESFHPMALLWYRLHRPEICRGQLAMNYQRQEATWTPVHWMSRHLLFDFLGRPDFIAYDIRDKKSFSKNICRRLFGAPSAGWTVRSSRQLSASRSYYDSFIFEGFLPKR